MGANEGNFHIDPWIIYHGAKIQQRSHGAVKFPKIDFAAKTANLLSRIAVNDDSQLSKNDIEKIAESAGLSVMTDLGAVLAKLEENELIQIDNQVVSIPGITIFDAIEQAVEIFSASSPSMIEIASIYIAEKASEIPIRRADIVEEIQDKFQFSENDTGYFFHLIESFQLVDYIGSRDNKIYYNGNLFRKDTARTLNVLESLSDVDSQKLNEVNKVLEKNGCISLNTVKTYIDEVLLKKLAVIGYFDFNVVGLKNGAETFITSPKAFNKFVSPMNDDSLDFAKRLLASLTYAITKSSKSEKIPHNLKSLLKKLVDGESIGYTSDIESGFHPLKMARIVELVQSTKKPNLYHLKLKKNEVGELALSAITDENSKNNFDKNQLIAPMYYYMNPETIRTEIKSKLSADEILNTSTLLDNLRVGF